jgi:uncharacterized protein (TIGR02231 family)
MKYLPLVLLSLLTTFQLFANEAPVRVPSLLRSATVYRNAAELTHTAKASIDAGNNELIIEGISNKIDLSSLQIGSDGNITIMSAQYATDFLKPAVKSPLIKKLEDSVAEMNEQLINVQVILKTDYELLELLKGGKEIRSGQTGITVTELVKLMDYYRAKTLELQNEIAVYKEKEKKIIELLNKYNNQINEEEQKNTRTGGRLELQLNSASSGNFNFTVSYITQTAGWTPYYDLRVANILKPLQLVYKARILQYSGIDWKQVKLILSTSTPNQHGNAPVFSSWFLGYVEAAQVMNNYRKANRLQSMAPAAMEKQSMPEVAGKSEGIGISEYVNVLDKELNVSFDISIPYDVPNNGKEQSVVLKEFEVPAFYKFYAAPKLDNDAYLLAEVPEWEKLNLLAGEANIIFEGTYVGKSYIDPNATTDTLNLTLGRDKRVVVKKEKLTDFSSVKFIGNTKKQLFTYEITVRNNKKEKLQMLLKDQMPLSTNKDIEVEVLETAQASMNPDNGVLTWKVDLLPGETKKFRISYSVKYPKDKVINLNGA